jgi:hypothetical protein
MLIDAMIQKLFRLHSFVRPRDSKIFTKWLLPKEDYVRGVHFNDAEHFIIVSDTGLHLVNHDTVSFIPYDVISSVTPPQVTDVKSFFERREALSPITPR